jgi:hypothetical protein
MSIHLDDMTIVNERPGDEAAVAELNRAAFGGADEARIVDDLRANGGVVLSLPTVRLRARESLPPSMRIRMPRRSVHGARAPRGRARKSAGRRPLPS